jgi:transcriptional regulator with XRE-family HTH domain
MKRDLGKGISQSYLSQIESGARPHLTHRTRQSLARFFKVHPGFLVDDLEGFQTTLASELRTHELRLDSWLLSAAETFQGDPQLSAAFRAVAEHRDSRACFLLLGAITNVPGLTEHLSEIFPPASTSSPKLGTSQDSSTRGNAL